MQETYGTRLQDGEIVGLTQAIATSEILCTRLWDRGVPFPVDSKIEKFQFTGWKAIYLSCTFDWRHKNLEKLRTTMDLDSSLPGQGNLDSLR